MRRRLGPGKPIPFGIALGPTLLLVAAWVIGAARGYRSRSQRDHRGAARELAAGLSRVGEALLDGPVQINRAIPTLALIPLFIVWFGIGGEMKLIVITASVLVPVYVNTHAHLRSVDVRYMELAETVQLSRAGFVRRHRGRGPLRHGGGAGCRRCCAATDYRIKGSEVCGCEVCGGRCGRAHVRAGGEVGCGGGHEESR
ncbi:ABC transporter permease subunit [Nocardia sp. NPDC050793]|uniref:ABC transporter permease n=1 Tax=Nocardia sp. NPDC050793 TaxID=3155159 RepID=UPI0033FF54AE